MNNYLTAQHPIRSFWYEVLSNKNTALFLLFMLLAAIAIFEPSFAITADTKAGPFDKITQTLTGWESGGPIAAIIAGNFLISLLVYAGTRSKALALTEFIAVPLVISVAPTVMSTIAGAVC